MFTRNFLPLSLLGLARRHIVQPAITLPLTRHKSTVTLNFLPIRERTQTCFSFFERIAKIDPNIGVLSVQEFNNQLETAELETLQMTLIKGKKLLDEHQLYKSAGVFSEIIQALNNLPIEKTKELLIKAYTYKGMALIHGLDDDENQAIECFNKVLELSPGDITATECLKSIDSNHLRGDNLSFEFDYPEDLLGGYKPNDDDRKNNNGPKA